MTIVYFADVRIRCRMPYGGRTMSFSSFSSFLQLVLELRTNFKLLIYSWQCFLLVTYQSIQQSTCALRVCLLFWRLHGYPASRSKSKTVFKFNPVVIGHSPTQIDDLALQEFDHGSKCGLYW